jgi:RNA polymerase sigma-70 factor (ECF subfamily)
MRPAARPKLTMIAESAPPTAAHKSATRLKVLAGSITPALAEFEHVYRGNVDVVMAYFARRCAEPQVVADLTSETFVRAAGGFGGFDPRRGSARAWLFGIAANVYAAHCQQVAGGRAAAARLAGHRSLEPDELEELLARIDAESPGRELIEQCAQLSELERAAIELVDLAGLTPKEAARALRVSRAALRKRLSRARNRLRKEHPSHE